MTGFRGIRALLALSSVLVGTAICWADQNSTAQSLVPPTIGFTVGTQVGIELEHSQIARFTLWLSNGFKNEMPGVVRISGGYGTQPGESNKIMLYGDRTEPRLTGEPDWQMTPRPANIYFTPDQTEENYTFPIGPAHTPPDELGWTQIYQYVACLNLDGGGTARGSASLGITDSK